MTSIANLHRVDLNSLEETDDKFVDLWCYFCGDLTEGTERDRQLGLLSQDEVERSSRYVFEQHRSLFIATRALLRSVLSLYIPAHPRDWHFSLNAYGKPSVLEPNEGARLTFNVTNTHGLVVCAISRAHTQLGVDAEWTGRTGETVSVAASYFSPAEVTALNRLPFDERRGQFFRYWTLKESYIKARGLGLAIPLDQFSFVIDDPNKITISFDPRLNDAPSNWHFGQFTAGDEFVIAVAHDCERVPIALRSIRYVPLIGAVPFE